jgi:hypothetical protein
MLIMTYIGVDLAPSSLRSFLIVIPLGPGIIKLITAVIYGFHNKLVFVPGKPFQPSLVFRDKH